MSTRLTRRQAIAGLAAAGLGLPGCATVVREPEPDEEAFAHGVASGDPDATSVVLWTRLSGSSSAERGRWQVAEDARFREPVAEGDFFTNPARDMTAKVVATGLAPGRRYYYRFLWGSRRSPVGRTRTLPTGAVASLGLAVASCSNYPFGHFNAYRAIAVDEQVDMVLHLGDYLYEYGPDGYGGKAGEQLGRAHLPPRETVTLADYRQRHAQYKVDPQSRLMHAAHPLLAIWDDHESTNNPWQGGAENHQPDTEGDWTRRLTAALRAYFEWMPVREPTAGGRRADYWRHFSFGDLASIITLESRHTGRARQLDYDDPAIDLDSGAGVAAFRAQLAAPGRAMLSASGEDFAMAALAASVQAGQPWRLVANQVTMARIAAPPVTDALLSELGITEGQRFYREAKGIQRLSGLGLPLLLDTWDGYPWARARFYQRAAAAGAQDLLVLTGDSHAFWQNQLQDDAGRPMGLELGTTGITSPGPFAFLGNDGAARIEQLLVDASPEVLWAEGRTNGYLRLVLERDRALADFVGVDTITSPGFKPLLLRRAEIRRREGLLHYA